jgi:hypothetical protein
LGESACPDKLPLLQPSCRTVPLPLKSAEVALAVLAAVGLVLQLPSLVLIKIRLL